jgi:hypothetical protein
MLESLGRFVATNSAGGIKWLQGCTALLLVAVSIGSCSFPNYGFSAAATGGAGGAAAVASVAGNADAGTMNGGAGIGGVSTGTGGASGAAGGASGDDAGSSGAAGAGEAGAEACTAEVPAALPVTCSNGTRDADETGVDCGGAVCAPCIHNEVCAQGRDCVSTECSASACVPLVQLETQAIVRTRDTNTLQFRFRLRYLSSIPQKLKLFSLRYYFTRGDAAEPLVPTSPQAVLNNATNLASETNWNVVRVLEAPPALTSAYLEVTFSSERILRQMDSLELTQSVQAGGAPGRQFDQLTHYSFVDGDSYSLNEHATVQFGQQIAWGTPPPYHAALGCFYTGVNFAGSALTLEGRNFLAGDDPTVAFTGSTLHVTSTPFPAPSDGYLPLLQSAIVLESAHATVQVPNGEYWAYPYVVSAGGTNQADLRIQGATAGTFVAGLINNKPAWAKLGPYAVSVSNGQVDLGSSGGALRLAGLELFQVAH